MLDTSEQLQSMLDTTLEIAKLAGADDIVNLLQSAEVTVEQTYYDNWNNGTYYFTAFLTVDVKTYVAVKNQLTELEEAVLGRFKEVLRHSEDEALVKTAIIPKAAAIKPEKNPHRPLSQVEVERQALLSAYLQEISEDQLIGEILMPLFRHLGFQRITAAGHKDKQLEYGKDIWMKYVLPTQNVIYFGIQAKKGKLDAAGMGKPGNANVAEVLNQLGMMLGHEIFDQEIGKKVLVDHAFIIAGGEITKGARNWLGGELDRPKRSQIMFMDRDDILNLFIVNNIPLPLAAFPPAATTTDEDNLPF